MNLEAQKNYLIQLILNLREESVVSKVTAFVESATKDETDHDFELSDAEFQELNRRRDRHLSGQSKSYSWEEVKQRVRVEE